MVVALALAAVFGSMSLANPAMAAVGQPADAELTERALIPQVTTLDVDIYLGEAFTFDLIPHLGGREDDVTEIAISPTAGTPAGVATFAEVDSRRDVGVVITPSATDLSGETFTTSRVTVTLGEGDNADEMVFFLQVTLNAITGAQLSGETQGTVTVPVAGTGETIGKPVFLKVDQLFVDGKGDDTGGLDGKITTYTPSSSAATSVVAGHVTVVANTAGDGFTFDIVPANTVATTDIYAYLDSLLPDNSDGSRPTGDGDTRGAEIDKLIDLDADDYEAVTTRTGYVVLYAPAGASENDFSTVTVTGTDGLTGEGNDDPQTSFLAIVGRAAGAPGEDDGMMTMRPSFIPSDDGPADVTSYEVKFDVTTLVNTRLKDLLIEFDGDYGIPSSIANTSVAITASNTKVPNATGTSFENENATVTFTPENVTVDGEKIFISLGDMDERDDRQDYDVDAGTVLTVLFRQSAGISNPTEAKGYNLVAIEFGDNKYEYIEDHETQDYMYLKTTVVRKISLSESDGGLGDTVTATGKGFKNGTTLTVFVDNPVLVKWDHDEDPATDPIDLTLRAFNSDAFKAELVDGGWPIPTNDLGVPRNVGTYRDQPSSDTTTDYVFAPNGRLSAGEDVLCVAASIGADDQGSCEFTVTHPTFEGGFNYVNAVDGRNGYAAKFDEFELKSSIQASPAQGSPGEVMLVQLVDFDRGDVVNKVEIGRLVFCDNDRSVPGSQTCAQAGVASAVDNEGNANFSMTIPNWARAGIQELKVTAGDKDASTNVTISGPVVSTTPSTVLANQRVSLVGSGFSPGSELNEMSIGGTVIHSSRINDSDPVRVDSGGNWSASVDLPLMAATTAAGERTIRITDTGNRRGVAIVTIPERGVTITPEAGRVGTIAVIRGTGFPSKNDEGSSFNIEIVYDAGNDKETTVSAVPDASGRFEVQLRIPTTASIPSTNTVRVEFEDDSNVAVVTTVAHEVPEGVITLSETSGGPGTVINISGEGFKSFVPISLVRLGALDVTPSPKPSTDGNGMMNFDVTIPGLDVGIQTIEVHVGRTTASTGFTVIASGVNPGDIKPTAEALEPLGDNLESIWHFNNDSKSWSFYDGEEGSDLNLMITGETYLVQIKATAEVILNGKTRNLTCVGGNCWNQIVW